MILEKLPVLVRCDGGCVAAAPYDALTKASAVIKSKLELSKWNRDDAFPGLDDLNNETASEKTGSDNRTCELSMAKIEILDIHGFERKAVACVFNHLLGHKGAIDTCHDFDILWDMLELCNQFKIMEPVSEIANRFSVCPTISSVSDLVAAFQMAEKLETVRALDYVAEKFSTNIIFNRCVAFARCNFTSWQVIVEFVNKIEEPSALIRKLFEELSKNSAVIRRRIKNIDKLDEEGPSYIVGNFEWKIHCEKDKDQLGIYVEVNNPCPESSDWTCEADIRMSLVDQKSGYRWIRFFSATFSNEDNEAGEDKFKKWLDVLHDYNYVKDNTLVVEADIKIKNTTGMLMSPEKSLSTSGWFNKSAYKDEENSYSEDIEGDGSLGECDDQEEENNCGEEGGAADVLAFEDNDHNKFILLCCFGASIALKKSILMRESKFFRSEFEEGGSGNVKGVSKEASSITKSFQLIGYHPTAFMAIFTHMQGFPQIMNSTTKFEIFKDMLRLCFAYGIDYTDEIAAHLDVTEVSMEVLVDAFMTGKVLSTISGSEERADNLNEKCRALAGLNLASWQHMLNFFSGRENIYPAIEIIRTLCDQKNCVIRHLISDLQRQKKIVSSQIIRCNFLWNIEISLKKSPRNEEILGIKLVCQSGGPVTDWGWSWSVSIRHIQITFYNQIGQPVESKDFGSHNFNSYSVYRDRDLPSKDMPEVKFWSEIVDETSGLSQHGKNIRIEVSFEIISSSGASDRWKVSEDMIR